MIKNIKFVVLAMLIACVLVSCQSNQENSTAQIEESPLYAMEQQMSNTYITQDISLLDLNIKKAGGIAFDGENLYITDTESGTINIYDKQLQIVEALQIPGVATPSLIEKAEQKAYILNNQTNILFVLSADLSKILNQYALPSKHLDSHYRDMSVLGEKIYVTLHTAFEKDAKIIQIDSDSGVVTQIGQSFVGSTYANNKSVYFINSMELYQESDRTGFRGGESYLFSLNENELVQKGNLISKSFPGDFICMDDVLFIYIAGWSSIDRYDQQLNYVDTIAKFEESDINAILTGEESRLFILFPVEQKLYEVKLK